MEYTSIPILDILSDKDFTLIDPKDPELMRMLRGTKAKAVVEGGKILAYMIVEDTDYYQDLLFIEVAPEYRGRGIAEEMLAHFLNHKPVKLVPLDPSTLKFFVRMLSKGIIKTLLLSMESQTEFDDYIHLLLESYQPFGISVSKFDPEAGDKE